MGKFIDITGQRFGRLVVIERIGLKHRCTLWKCKCDCGNETEVITGNLSNGHTKSCGCLCKEVKIVRMTTHGMRGTKLYGVWASMSQRCNNPNIEHYQCYGGRGITVCDEWSEFINFYNWAMANGYSDGLTIDRKDNEGNYSPDNCKWSTMKEQNNNTRKNVWYEYQGEKKTISQWSDVCGMPYEIIDQRIRHGWTIEKSLNTPVKTPIRIKKII